MMSVGPVAESLVWAEELLSAGEDLADEELLLVGHMAVMVTNFWLGNPLVVERHARAIMERYVQPKPPRMVTMMLGSASYPLIAATIRVPTSM
jgi:hypothetical protein